jgi:hypothetical protein
MKRIPLVIVMCALLGALSPLAAQEDLAKGFAQPPNAAKPRVYWWWLMSLVSKEGITKDLEELHAKGGGGVMIFDCAGVGVPMPHAPAFMSPGWRENFKHALREADRLGLEVSVNMCSGWDAGGPWITPAHASKHFQQSTWNVTGPRRISGKLPKPVGDVPSYREVAVGVGTRPRGSLSDEQLQYRDVAVQAVPRKPEAPQVLISASSAQPAHPADNAADGVASSFWVSDGYKPGDAPTREKPEWIRLDFSEPFTARTLRVAPNGELGPREIELQVSGGTDSYRTIQSFQLAQRSASELTFPETSARSFRILITAAYGTENVQVREVKLGDMGPAGNPISPVLALKSGRESFSGFGENGPVRGMVEAPLADPEPLGDRLVVAPERIVDLTAKLGPDGQLDWDAPPGEWTIVRTGFGCNNDQIMCASPGAAGPCVDFLSAAATDFHFKNTAEILLQDAGPLAGKTLKYFHDDSWEAGLPNWTDSFLDDFKKYRGYDVRPYLPVLTGAIVGSVEVSDRFLYDFRKTIGDCLADNHYGRLAELAHARGVKIHCEAGGPCYPRVPPLDALKNLGRTDIPMGEFWQSGQWKENGQHIAGKQTASAAHIYGKTFAAAEAFTSTRHYLDDFADLKPTADKAFCEGTNRFFLHTWTSSRPEDGVPGYEYGAGTHFNRNVTWWPMAGAFFSYISRCQYLLQQGLFAADVCYYYGDNTPNQVEVKHVDPSLGPGYDYDVCNAEVLLTRMEARDGRIVLPDGMSYRLLVLPDRRTMPVEVLRKIKSLVESGATVVGPKPVRDPGLKNYPQCDADVKKLADEIWGDCDGQNIRERRYGQGRIFWGKPLREILHADGVQPDFEHKGGNAKTFLDFIHRRAGGAEIYFVCNRNANKEQLDVTFRVSGKQPELWDAVKGEMRPAKAFRQEAGRTIVPLEFGPYGSCFVVFQKAIATSAAGPEQRNYLTWSDPREIGGGWEVTFDPKWGGPEKPVVFNDLSDWTDQSDPGIKHYSGKATYRKTFDVPEDFQKVKHLRLNLGVVKNVAEVRLNGRNLGVVWAEPFSVDITDAVKPTGNKLEVDVINLWPNRLIFDAGLPAEKRLTRTSITMDPNAPLLDSGLLGPVTLQVATSTLNAADKVATSFAGVPLIAVAKPDQCVTKGQTVTLDASNSRLPAGPTWKYQWRQISGPEVALRDAGKPQASLAAQTQADYEFELLISDGQRSSADQVRVSVMTPTGVTNGDFERADGGGMPVGWKLARTFPTANVAIDPKGGEAGSAALRITTQPWPTPTGNRRNGVVLSQRVQLEPYRVYLLKARMRGENVQQGLWNNMSPEYVGPSVAVDGWLSESFRNVELNANLKGTFGWTDVELDFPTGGDGTATVRLQSGQGLGGKVGTGIVWIDNVRVEPAADRVTIMGRHIVRFFRKEALDKLQPGQAQEYVQEIDAYYDTMSDLTGKAWYGKQVFFHPLNWSIWEGAWSGNPALVGGEEIESWEPGKIREVAFQGGPIHELAHNLAVTPLWGEIPPGTLAFYAVAELDLTCGNKRGMAAVDEYHAVVHKIGQEGWAKGRVNWNLIQDKFMLIAKQAGWRRAWDAFKQVFRMVLVAQEPDNPRASYWKIGVDFPASEYTPEFVAAMKGNMWQQFKAVFDAASRISGFDMWSVFSKEELATFEKQLSRNDLSN